VAAAATEVVAATMGTFYICGPGHRLRFQFSGDDLIFVSVLFLLYSGYGGSGGYGGGGYGGGSGGG